MSVDRVQKILARAGVASRRKAEELIVEGRVTVNGTVVGLGDKADPREDAIKVDGKRIQLPREHTYLVLNKPKGYVTTVADPEGRPTVMDLVPPQFRKALVPVGRLDFQTEGLLLLTDDGEFALRLSHPRYNSKKTYAVKVKGTPEEAGLDKIRAGVVIDGKRTSPCKIRARRLPAGGREIEAGNSWWTVELFEGRTRQIREMFFRIGHPVQKLRRVAIGRLEDPNLPLGGLRELDAKEVGMLLAGAREGKQRPPAGKSPPFQRRAHARPPADGAAVPAPPSSRSFGERPSTGGEQASRRLPGARAAAMRTAGQRRFGERSSEPRPPGRQPSGRRPGGPERSERRPFGGGPPSPGGPDRRPTGGRPPGPRSPGRRPSRGRPTGDRPSGGRRGPRGRG
jgi:23S rRNA pseudouridine2605 synthase